MSSLCVKAAEVLAASKTVPFGAERYRSLPVVLRKKPVLHLTSNINAHNRSYSMNNYGAITASCGFSDSMKVRFVHTDVTKVPDFSNYRAKQTKDPTVRSSDSEIQRKIFGYSTMFAGAVLAATAVKYTMKSLVMPLGPTAKTLAEASTEVNLTSIPEGKNLVVKWRNKPLFIRHRTKEEIERERSVPISSLRDPEKDEDRVKQDKWLICIGVCTHLGCVPQANAGDFPGGFYCPCHGSHYDASGRIRKGPAPLNLEVPEYRFVDENTVIVG